MPHCLRCLLFVPAMLLSSGSPTSAEAQNPSPAVEQFVRVRSPTVILAHVTVIDGTGKPAVGDRNVTIDGGKIIRIEAAGRVAEKEGTTTLDLRGYTVVPGFVGMHNHLYYIARPNLEPGKTPASEPPLLVPQMMFSSPRLYLAGGVTTMRTTGSIEPYADLNLRDQIDAGMLPGPHIDVTAPYLEGKSDDIHSDAPARQPGGGGAFRRLLGRRRHHLVQGLHAHHARRIDRPPSIKPTSTGSK